jgi:hypothetical protein
MPNGYNNSDYAFVLPDRGLTDAQKLSYLQNQRQLDEQRQERLQKQKEQQEGQNLNTINDELDWKKYATGEQAIDNYSQGELQKIYNDALRNHINDDPVALEGWLQNNIQPLALWHTKAINTFKDLNSNMQDFNKTYPNTDIGKTKDILYNQFQNDFLNVDANGQITRKNTDDIRPSNYNAIMQDPTFLGTVTNDTTPFSKFFYDIPKTSVGDKQYTNKQGHVKAYAWSGLMPEGVGEIATDQDNKPTSIQLRGDVIPSMTDAQGNPAKTLPNDIMARLQGNPAAYAAAQKLWLDQKSKMPVSPQNEGVLKNAFLYNQANQLVAHPLKTEEIQKEPKPPRITVNVDSTNGTNINDVYKEIVTKTNAKPHLRQPVNELSSTAQSVVLKIARDVSGDKELNQGDILIAKDQDGNYSIYNANDNSLIAPLDFTNTNLPVNKSVKQQQKILSQQPQKSSSVNQFEQYKRKQ